MPANALYCGEKEPEWKRPLESSPDGEAPVSGKPRIVIIEDEFFVAWNMQSMLRDLNFDFCEIAGDAESGVDIAIRHAAELLLVDLNLGDGPDGVEAVRRIREYRNVAVIFVTAYTDEANLRRIRQLSPEAPILSKPVSPDLLGQTIRKMFPAS
jgi:two-component system, response regulator PdtaR